MEPELHPIFKSYREYVALCIEKNEDVPTLSEFTGSGEPFKVEEEPEPAKEEVPA